MSWLLSLVSFGADCPSYDVGIGSSALYGTPHKAEREEWCAPNDASGGNATTA